MERIPTTELTPFSSEDVAPTAWERGLAPARGRGLLGHDRGPDGRPHVTPLIGAWWEGALHFTTGAAERKGGDSPPTRTASLTTGVNTLADGVDVAVEGEAEEVTDPATRAGVADAFVAKYGPALRAAAAPGPASTG